MLRNSNPTTDQLNKENEEKYIFKALFRLRERDWNESYKNVMHHKFKRSEQDPFHFSFNTRVNIFGTLKYFKHKYAIENEISIPNLLMKLRRNEERV